VFAIFFAAIPIGSALGYSLGGIMDTLFGWREAFFVAGLPGLVCAWFVLRLPDPPRGLHDDPVAVPDSAHAKHGLAGALTSYRTLLRNEPYLVTVLGYAAYTFAVGGLAFWIPTYLEREKGQSIGEATVLFGAIVLVAGLLGTVGGGYLGDWLLSRLRNAYLWVAGVATLVAAPFAFVAIEAESAPIYVPTMLVAMILLFVSASPVNSAIVNAVRADERATAIALSILTIHLLGDVPSPLIIGYVSDATSLETALTIVPFVILGAAVIWLFAALRTRDVSAPAG
jgi:predicted MFS family arabinose efflux permease